MALYDFAKGIILEAGNKVPHMMKEDLDIEICISTLVGLILSELTPVSTGTQDEAEGEV